MTQNVAKRKQKELNPNFGKRVQDARAAVGMTNFELAQEVGVAERTVIRWQAGEVPPYSRLAGLARALRQPPSHFFEVLAFIAEQEEPAA